MATPVVQLVGMHNVRLPVADLERSFKWYKEFLGYQRDFEFKRPDGSVSAWALEHQDGGTPLVLVLDPDRAKSARGFPFLSFGVPDESTIRQLEARFDSKGIKHGGVHPAFVGLKLPFVEDPDGHLIGFFMVGRRAGK